MRKREEEIEGLKNSIRKLNEENQDLYTKFKDSEVTVKMMEEWEKVSEKFRKKETSRRISSSEAVEETEQRGVGEVGGLGAREAGRMEERVEGSGDQRGERSKVDVSKRGLRVTIEADSIAKNQGTDKHRSSGVRMVEDDGGTWGSPGKRRFDHTYSGSGKRVGSEKRRRKPVWCFFGDSQLKEVTSQDGLNLTALEDNREVRMRRGGYMQDVQRMISDNIESLKEGDDALIIVGGNDSSHLASKMIQTGEIAWNFGRVQAEVQELERQFREGMLILKKKRVNVIVLMPPPRGDEGEMGERMREMVALVMKKVCIKAELQVMTAFMAEQTEEDFVSKLPDGVHMTGETTQNLIIKAAKRLKRPVQVKELVNQIEKRQVWPTLCWYCGRDGGHCKKWLGGAHDDFKECWRCGRKYHDESVCWCTVKMCRKCGRTGLVGGRGLCHWY